MKPIAYFCITVFIFAFTFAMPAQTAGRQMLHGHVPSITARLQSVNRLAPATRLGIIIGLPLRNQQEADDLFQQIYDPASPNYHKYLTPDQFAQRFGPTEQDYQTLIDFAKTNGLTVTGTHPNRTLLDVSGTVAQIEKVFHVSMRVYQHPTEARTFFAPDVEPSLDLNLPVLHISGLDNYILPRPKIRHRPANSNNATPKNGSGQGGNYMGNDFRVAYVPGVTLTGSGQAVGLFQLDGYYPNDIVLYESKAGLPNVPLQNVFLDGFNGTPGEGNSEVALDIEMAISMAPGLSQVIVYEGIDGNDILNRMATDNLANQLSCSWDFNIDANTENIFIQFGIQGQSFFDASGDHDAYVGTIPSPDADPHITVVGGTSLVTSGPGGAWVSESVWNDNDGTNGSGGGISTNYSIPGWQQGINMGANGGSTSTRNIPDVALVADNVYIVADNGRDEPGTGGTSVAAPLWAGFMALVNQQRATNGAPPIGFLNPALYAIGQGANYASCFHDITTGNNTNKISPNKFYAVSGYDLCTGLGTIGGTNLINALQPGAIALFTILHSLNGGSDGAAPMAGLVLSGNTLYGTAYYGGSSGFGTMGGGTVFSVKTDGSEFTVLNNFLKIPDGSGGYYLDNNGGYYSSAGLILSGNTLYGTASWGGTVGDGTAFSINTDGSGFTTIKNFAEVLNGYDPSAGLVLSGSTLYGTTSGTLSSYFYPTIDDGTVFAVNTDGTGFMTLNVFTNGSDGSVPMASLLFSGNTLYGTAEYGGVYGKGTVFKVNTDGTGFSTLHSFTAFYYGNYGNTNKDGGCPVAGLILSGNTLYGTAEQGGVSGYGTVFKVNTDGTGFTNLYYFNGGSGGSSPLAGLILSGNILYGTAAGGGSSGNGIVFSLKLLPPYMKVQPYSQFIAQGTTATFSATAGGTPALTYQWQFKGGNLTAATNASLVIPNVQPSNAGSYAVIVTNNYGAITSAVVTLTVGTTNTPPQIIASGANFGFQSNKFGFNINGYVGQRIVVDGSTNLTQWIPLLTNSAGSSPYYFVDPASTNFRWRYYRAHSP